MKIRNFSALSAPSAKKQWPNLLILSAASLLAGLLGGLLGAGGGVILLLVLQRIHPKGQDLRDVFATALAITVPLALPACLRYSAHGSLRVTELSPFLPAALAGGLCGGLLLGRIRLEGLRLLFSALMILSGFLLLMQS